MKTPEAVVADINRRLTARWHTHLADDEAAFPHAFPLGRPSATELKADYSAFHARTVAWQDWAHDHEVDLVYVNRTAKGGTTQVVPTHVRINSVDRAAAIVGEEWPERLVRGRRRLAVLRQKYPELPDTTRVLRLVDGYSDVDFGLLLTVADWYLEDPSRVTAGMTPRQVPIPGVHAKWLQNHTPAVRALTDIYDLGLLPPHQPRIHFTYLDPTHKASGRRVQDSATVGDTFSPAYLPEVVIISENKDTAIHFPQVPGGISVEGVGKGGKTPALFPWIREAPMVIYWGDMDKDGYEILDGYRTDFGRDIESILMDAATYNKYEQFGTDLDQHGKPIGPGLPRQVDNLRDEEKTVYLRILSAQHDRHRRVEQERIPLEIALKTVERMCRPGSRRSSHTLAVPQTPSM